MPVAVGPCRRWLSGRALALHAALLVAVPLCGVAAWWQVDRALSGNGLSWMYVFEWPAFAGIAVWLWWVMLHTPARSPAPAEPAQPARPAQPGRLAARATPLRWEPAAEDDRLRAYNAFLADLNSGRPANRPRITRPHLTRR